MGVDARQPDFDQADHQSANRRLGQSESLAEIDQTQPSGFCGNFVQRGGGTA